MAKFKLQNISDKNIRKGAFVKLAVEPALRAESELQKEYFIRPSHGWRNHRPSITHSAIKKDGGAKYIDTGVLRGGGGNNVYSWISWGTRMRIIRPRRKKYLRFLAGYKASTTPGSLQSFGKQRFPPWKARKRVRHRIAARGFDSVIADRRKDKFPHIVQLSMDNFSRYFWI